MDHLYLPKFIDHPWTIPRLSTIRFDNKYLNQYPDAILSKYEGEWREKMEAGNLSEVMPSLQTWLFFGLLQTFFKRSSQKIWKDFSREATKTTEASVTTKALVDYTIRYLPTSEFTLNHQQHACRCLLVAYDVLNSVCKHIKSPTCSLVILSFSVLGEYLSKVMVCRFSDHDRIGLPPILLRAWPAGRLSSGHFLSGRMQEDGWCPKDIAKQMQNLSTSGMYHASRFGNPDASKSHERCTYTLCDVARVPNHFYRTEHVCEDGNCGILRANQDQLESIVQRGLIPLISPADDAVERNQNSYLNLIEPCPDTIYVAISHIWSEGLGNEAENSLPRCQLVRLSQYVKDLYRPEISGQVFFWIDTICCPRKPRDLRGLAISKMRDTYMEADKVIVLDSWLQTQEMEDDWHYELALKVFSSKWSKRLWTLQEGALARKVAFRFKHASFPYKDKVYREDLASQKYQLHLDRKNLEQVMIRADCTVAYRTLRGYQLRAKWGKLDNVQTLGLLRGLKHRDTSNDNDEGLCLGALFNLDLKKIWEAKSVEGRMAAVWKLLPDIPPSLIFSFGPRLHEKGFRWAPSQFRWSTSAYFDDNVGYVPPAGKLYTASNITGLLVQYPGVLLHCPRRPLCDEFYFKTEQWYRVSCNTFYKNRKLEFGLENPQPIENFKHKIDWCKDVQSSLETEGVGLLLSVDLEYVHPLIDYRAILVSIQGRENGMFLAKYESTISITRVAQIPEQLYDAQLNNDVVRTIEETTVQDRHSKWCLS